MGIEASFWQISLSTKLEEISDLRIFSKGFRGPLQTLWLQIAHPCLRSNAQNRHPI